MLAVVIISGDGGGHMGLKLKNGIWPGDSDWVVCVDQERCYLLGDIWQCQEAGRE